MNLYKYLKILLKQILLNPSRKPQFILLFVLIFISSFAELFSLSAIFPFLGVLSSPSNVFKIYKNYNLEQYFYIKDEFSLIFPVTVMFIIAIVLSSFLRILLLWYQTKLSFSIVSWYN